MPNYYNPYNNVPMVNYNGAAYPNYQNYMQPAQSYATATQPQVNALPGMIWVDGEVGAKAFQMPAGVTGPVALWDMNAPIIYLKSINQMGMPNPLQRINYQVEETPQQQMLPVGQSGNMQPANPDYATKDELNAMRNDIQAMRQMLERQGQNTNQNGGNNQTGNRGGNR